jgi:hypothetical protein
LDNYDNVQYSGTFTLGDQALPVIYDTGSFEIIVLSTLCKKCGEGLSMYDRKRSASFSSGGGVASEHLFGSGPVVTEQGFELVHIGKKSSQYQVGHMPFWQVVSHEMAVWDEKAHFSGIVGLGHTSTVPEGYASKQEGKETMLAAMGIDSFAFCLERGGEDAPGWLILGPTVAAQAHGTGLFQSLAVVGKTHWGVKMTGFHVDGIDLADPCSSSGCGAIIDSGSSLLAAPMSARKTVRAIEALVKSDCSNLQQLPVLQIQLGDALVELPPKAYVMQVSVEAPKNSTIYKKLGPLVMRECFAAFMVIDQESDYGPLWVLGMSFLRYYYTVFDRTSKRIHITKSSPECQSPLLSEHIGSVQGFGTTGLLNGSNRLLNTTQQHLGHRSHSGRSFAAADYEPTKVDLSEARVPGWAVSEEVRHIRL